MFTGLIQTIGEIREIKKDGDWRLVIGTDMDLSKTPMGASICCSGCCLTVVEKGEDWFAVDVSAESLSLTTIENWDVGTKINLEPSLQMGDELGGHFVFGHVDGLATLNSIEKDGDSFRLKIQCPGGFSQYIASKGSVSLDGISLTVNEVEGDVFGVCIIPHTWEQTTLQYRQPGDAINFEVDMLARYVARQLNAQMEQAA